MENLQPHQLRVIEERDELQKKVESLTAFIVNTGTMFSKLDLREQALLRQQHKHMDSYLITLNARIEYFK